MNRLAMSVLALIVPLLLLGSASTAYAQNAPIANASPDQEVHGILFGDHLSVVCPTSLTSHPMFKETDSGRSFRITDPRLRAIAAKACESAPPAELGVTPGSVNIVNERPTAIFVSFTLMNHTPGPITWGANCTPSGSGAMIAAGTTCAAVVSTTAGSSRFCAALDHAPADCFKAQHNHQTMVETNFLPGPPKAGCFGSGNCVWYDISVIPTACTDALWQLNQCAGLSGASYNLPVALACGISTTYMCLGPTDTTYGPENYPKNCGNPNATCVGNQAGCVNAYFYPMYSPPENKYGPNAYCGGTHTLGIVFMAGS